MAQLVRRGLLFEPTRIEGEQLRTMGRRYKAARDLAALDKLDGPVSVSLYGGKGDELFLDAAEVPRWNMGALYWKLPDDVLFPSETVEWMTRLPGFTAAYAGDCDDALWQSQRAIQSYEGRRPHEHLPKRWNGWEWEIDISVNPGRRTLFPGFWIYAAWRMWFGPNTYPFLPVERLRSFPHAERIEALDGGVTFIELWSDPDDVATPHARERQRQFREWMDLDGLEDRADEVLREVLPDDPAFELDYGDQGHGGWAQITTWLDAERKPIRRSEAVYVHRRAFTQGGDTVWSETAEIRRGQT